MLLFVLLLLVLRFMNDSHSLFAKTPLHSSLTVQQIAVIIDGASSAVERWLGFKSEDRGVDPLAGAGWKFFLSLWVNSCAGLFLCLLNPLRGYGTHPNLCVC